MINGNSSANPVVTWLDRLKSNVRSAKTSATQLRIATVREILVIALLDAMLYQKPIKRYEESCNVL